jgi:hypothetical protein
LPIVQNGLLLWTVAEFGGADKPMTPEQRARFHRFCWIAILGSLVVIAGSIEAVRAIYANDFWAQQGWMMLSFFGGAIVFLAWRRFSRTD